MNAPAQSRPPVVPISLGGAAKVAFVSSQDGRVYALDADSGAQLWVSPVLGDMVQGGVAAEYTQFGADYDLILVGTRNSSTGNSFYGLNLADGTVAWSFDNGGGANAIGLIGGTANVDWATNRVYFASRSRVGGSANTVWCLSFTDSGASLVWARQLGDVDGTLLLDSGRVYVGTNNGLVHALDAATGASLWAAPFATNDGPVKGYVWRRPSTNQLLFSTTTTVWSLTDAGATASLAWSLGTIPNPSTPLVSPLSPWAWVGGSDGRLYQLSLSGGLPTPTSTQLEPGAVTVGSPALSIAEGRAYVGTDTGRIYAVDVPF
jgi:outer membrane protein assembly factor BamB